jgi:hypothetical protein
VNCNQVLCIELLSVINFHLEYRTRENITILSTRLATESLLRGPFFAAFLISPKHFSGMLFLRVVTVEAIPLITSPLAMPLNVERAY